MSGQNIHLDGGSYPALISAGGTRCAGIQKALRHDDDPAKD
jgi:hypothetical protein